MPFCLRTLVGALCLVAAALPAAAQDVVAQDVLTLEEALRLARERNGLIRAAEQDVRAAQSRVAQAAADFYPTLTPQYQYNDIKRERDQQSFAQSGDAGLVRFNWQILDSGQRDLTLRSQRRATEATRFNARQTLRETLFTTTQQYYDTLRTQELQRVADSQVGRAQTILEQTRARIAVRDAAPIEELQANADFQNARVNSLTARNRVTTNAASLRATIGLQAGERMPALQRETEAPVIDVPADLPALVAEGLANRPDLVSRRRNIEAQLLNRRRAQRDAGIGLSVDLFDDFQIFPDRLNDRTFQVTATYPLFDGGLRRAIIREAEANIQSNRYVLLQEERNVQAAIESAYAELTTNTERLEAARVALDAATRNYQAAIESRTAGATDLIQVLTAQVSLVTAESNFIEALYDSRITEARLRLVTGRPVPGETTP
ncbi:MAG: TolC family protein [Fimbriimonas sp.]